MGILLLVSRGTKTLRTSLTASSAMFGTAGFSCVALLVPGAPASDKGGKIDWIGAYLGVGGLILFNFVWK